MITADPSADDTLFSPTPPRAGRMLPIAALLPAAMSRYALAWPVPEAGEPRWAGQDASFSERCRPPEG